MDEGKGQFVVFFEDPFWVGVFEEIEDGNLSVCKVTFGKEPTEEELWEFVLKNYHKLRFTPSVSVEVKQDAKNPKRRQREAKKQLSAKGIGTKSQQALQLQREQNKLERNVINKEAKDERISIGGSDFPPSFLICFFANKIEKRKPHRA